jgi:hypothetical protein
MAEGATVDTIEFGIDTFGDLPRDDRGQPVSYAAAIRQVVAEAVLADQAGVDVIAVGEHHRPEFSISAPEAVLAGIATRTSRIHLASGVTVLSSADPVRVFQRFATVDALSGGRAEVILGRGSFTESGRLTTWVGVGGSPESVARKMTAAIRALGVGRFDLIYSTGVYTSSARLRGVELYATRVVPLVKEMLADEPGHAVLRPALGELLVRGGNDLEPRPAADLDGGRREVTG